MASNGLKAHEVTLLKEILLKHSPALIHRIDTFATVPLTAEELEAFQDVLGDELCTSGLRPDSDPNTRGLAIESLIDRLWHLSQEAQDLRQ
jgi:hypothetical protein